MSCSLAAQFAGIIPRMKISNRAIVGRIDERLSAVGLSARKASLDSGLGPDAIRDLKRDELVMPRLDTIMALAGTLRTTPEYLSFGVTETEVVDPAYELPVIGEVAAGIWHDVSITPDESPFSPIAGGRNIRFPREGQYGLVVRGTSVNRQAAPGDILRCLDIGVTGLMRRPGDLVIVERRRAQLGQKEVTAKVYKRVSGRDELWPDSDDPRWSQPILTEGISEDEEVVIVAIVDRIIRQLRED